MAVGGLQLAFCGWCFFLLAFYGWRFSVNVSRLAFFGFAVVAWRSKVRLAVSVWQLAFAGCVWRLMFGGWCFGVGVLRLALLKAGDYFLMFGGW